MEDQHHSSEAAANKLVNFVKAQKRPADLFVDITVLYFSDLCHLVPHHSTDLNIERYLHGLPVELLQGKGDQLHNLILGEEETESTETDNERVHF